MLCAVIQIFAGVRLRLTNQFNAFRPGQVIYPPALDDSYLVATPHMEFSINVLARPVFSNSDFFVQSMSYQRSADSIMQGVVDWITDRNVLDQSELLGDDFSQHRLMFYTFLKGTFPSCIGQFTLSDYLFDDCASICDYDHFMRSLDRDRLSSGIYGMLLDSLELRAEDGYEWKKAFRMSCHPDYPRWVSPAARAVCPVPAAVY